MQYRRINAPGGTFFFTLVTYERRQVLREEQAVILLRTAFRSVLQKHPLMIEAAIDHLHMIWRLPENDGDYASSWRLIKNDCWVSRRSTQPTGYPRLNWANPKFFTVRGGNYLKFLGGQIGTIIYSVRKPIKK